MVKSSWVVVSWLVLGSVVLSACGGQGQDAGSAGAGVSASASVGSADVEVRGQLPGAVTAFYEAMLAGAPKDLSDGTLDILNSVEASSEQGRKLSEVLEGELTSEQLALVVADMRGGADPLYGLVDHSKLSDAQSVELSLYMIYSAESLFDQTVMQDAADMRVTVDQSKVDFKDDGTALVPAGAMTTPLQQKASASASASSEQGAEFGLPMILVDGSWKVDGQRYLELAQASAG